MSFEHVPVLLNETLEALNINENGVYIDATAGGGGHSEAILKKLKKGKLISIDQDPDAIKALKGKLSRYNSSIVVESNFSKMDEIIKNLNIEKVDGILMDLGVSSHQLDTRERGFSYHKEAFLDMRMNKTGVSAYDLVNNLSWQDLAKIIYAYGEEKFARKIALAIDDVRKDCAVTTTTQLVQIIKDAVPAFAKREKHPAKKVFQALRIEVNDELNVLKKGLDLGLSILKSGGYMAIITFHSLEDKIVKKKMSSWNQGCICPSDFPICTCGKKPLVKIINKKYLKLSREETELNRRSRSAKLRACTIL